ncbi:MAG: hypothetical protein OJF62_003634 [Pseudolabrys sp.]|nr:hypothetical protein [Pseudolabrys sp.]
MVTTGIPQHISSALAALMGWVRRGDDLAALDPREVSAIALDLGLSDQDLRAIVAQGPHAARQLVDRMAAIGLDAASVANMYPEVMRDMQRLCSLCVVKGRCTHELATHTDAHWPDYCPNAPTLQSLQTGT